MMVIGASPQTLSGDWLISHARVIPDSDFDGIQRNNRILYALRRKLLDSSVWVRLPILYEQFKNMFVTDLRPQQVFSLFCLLRETPKKEIIVEQLEPKWTSLSTSDSFPWDKD